ncbi:MAG: SpoIIE family protein phosphatase [Planctomycetales bacterium]|nr:SpoIIE family protein phosphatase [Planctomycetales bacterium]
MDVASGLDGLRRLWAVAPGATGVPVITVGEQVTIGFDPARLAALLGLEPMPGRPGPSGPGQPPRSWPELRQIRREAAGAAPSLAEDLELARRVHRSLLPPDLRRGGVSVAVRMRPRIGVGGDYASAVPTAAGRIYLAVSDVTGHGVSAALLVTRVNSLVLGMLAAEPEPCAVIEELNRFLCDHFEGLGMFLTFFLVRLDPDAGRIEYLGAGHPPALLLRADGTVERARSDLPPLGISPETVRSCRTCSTPLRPGDTVVLYSDGMSEARAPSGEPFGEERLAAAIREALPGGAGAAAEAALAAVERHAPGPVADDRIVLAARFR